MIKYVIGDATQPQTTSNKNIIAHVVNDAGKWGAGFALALSSRYPEARMDYLEEHAAYGLHCGDILWSDQVNLNTGEIVHICNMVAMEGVRKYPGHVPLSYISLEACLEDLAFEARLMEATVHMPRIGSGLAGGKWEIIGPMIEKYLDGIEVLVYALPS